jgi:hypothetical protein
MRCGVFQVCRQTLGPTRSVGLASLTLALLEEAFFSRMAYSFVGLSNFSDTMPQLLSTKPRLKLWQHYPLQKRVYRNNTMSTAEHQEPLAGWVRCDRCDEWHKLPSPVPESSLPDKWYCENATWDLKAPSCAVLEDGKMPELVGVEAEAETDETDEMAVDEDCDVPTLAGPTMLAGPLVRSDSFGPEHVRPAIMGMSGSTPEMAKEDWHLDPSDDEEGDVDCDEEMEDEDMDGCVDWNTLSEWYPGMKPGTIFVHYGDEEEW